MNHELLRTNLKIATGAQRPENGATIRETLALLDQFARDEAMPGDLAHYLSRRSYVKALDWLDQADMPHRP